MGSMSQRTIALVLAGALPRASAAAEPTPIAAPTEASVREPATPEPIAEAPPPAEMPAPAEPPVEPAPVETPEPPPPSLAEPPPDPLSEPDFHAQATQDLGASAMIAGGGITVAGVILIFAGFGATAHALKKSSCSDDACLSGEAAAIRAARVTLAGLIISGLGSITLVGGMITYGVGRSRVARAREARLGGVVVAPSRGGVTLGLRGRF